MMVASDYILLDSPIIEIIEYIIIYFITFGILHGMMRSLFQQHKINTLQHIVHSQVLRCHAFAIQLLPISPFCRLIKQIVYPNTKI